MKKVWIKITILSTLVLLALTALCSCGPNLTLASEVGELKAGETFQLEFTRGDETVNHEELLYASENTSVATVDDNGLVTASAPGQTCIHVQTSSGNQKTKVMISVVYDVKDEMAVTFNDEVQSIEIYGTGSAYPFFERNGYSPRVDDWDVLEVAKVIVGKSEDDYVFTDVYRVAWAHNDDFIVLSDWGNADVTLSESVLTEADLSAFITNRLEYENAAVAEEGEAIAMEEIKTKMADMMKKLQYRVAISELPADYEYKVSVKINYQFYRTVNYYSKGLLSGLGSVIKDLFKADISSVLNSYTYSETLYEVMLNYCDLVIERRPRGGTMEASDVEMLDLGVVEKIIKD